MAIRKIFVAFFEARILPEANSASVTPTTTSVAMTAWVTMPPPNRISYHAEMPPTKMPCTPA